MQSKFAVQWTNHSNTVQLQSQIPPLLSHQKSSSKQLKEILGDLGGPFLSTMKEIFLQGREEKSYKQFKERLGEEERVNFVRVQKCQLSRFFFYLLYFWSKFNWITLLWISRYLEEGPKELSVLFKHSEYRIPGNVKKHCKKEGSKLFFSPPFGFVLKRYFRIVQSYPLKDYLPE